MGLVELGGAVVVQAAQRVEFSAQNITNMTTAGYKSRRPFFPLVDALQGMPAAAPGIPEISVDFSAGKLRETKNPFDLAITGNGFFAVRAGDNIYYTRAGQFHRDENGFLATLDGAIVQSRSGDVAIDGGDINVLADGTVEQAGQPIAQLAIMDFEDRQSLRPVGAGLFAAAPGAVTHDVSGPQIHQGMLEASNVSTAGEMVAMMAALRSAESGQRIVQVYDDLMGRALSTFGQM